MELTGIPAAIPRSHEVPRSLRCTLVWALDDIRRIPNLHRTRRSSRQHTQPHRHRRHRIPRHFHARTLSYEYRAVLPPRRSVQDPYGQLRGSLVSWCTLGKTTLTRVDDEDRDGGCGEAAGAIGRGYPQVVAEECEDIRNTGVGAEGIVFKEHEDYWTMMDSTISGGTSVPA